MYVYMHFSIIFLCIIILYYIKPRQFNRIVVVLTHYVLLIIFVLSLFYLTLLLRTYQASSLPVSLEVTFAAYLAVLLGTFLPVTFLIVLYSQSEARKAGLRGQK